MFYLNTIEQLFQLVEQYEQSEVYLACSRHLTGLPVMVVFQNLRLHNNKMTLSKVATKSYLEITN